MIHPGELLSALLDGELSQREVAQVSRHLESCGRCHGELQDLAKARAAIRSLPLVEMPPDLGPAGADVIALRRRPAVWAGAAAAALVTVIVGASLAAPPEPVVFDATELQTVFVARSAADDAFTPSKAAVVPVGPAGLR